MGKVQEYQYCYDDTMNVVMIVSILLIVMIIKIVVRVKIVIKDVIEVVKIMILVILMIFKIVRMGGSWSEYCMGARTPPPVHLEYLEYRP